MSPHFRRRPPTQACATTLLPRRIYPPSALSNFRRSDRSRMLRGDGLKVSMSETGYGHSFGRWRVYCRGLPMPAASVLLLSPAFSQVCWMGS
ncbi:hypothetical protein D3C80_1803950 [compost metagenome]